MHEPRIVSNEQLKVWLAELYEQGGGLGMSLQARLGMSLQARWE